MHAACACSSAAATFLRGKTHRQQVALQSAMPDIVWHAFKGPRCSNHSENEYDCFDDEDVIDALLGVAPEEDWLDEDEGEGAVSEQEEL